MQFTETECKLHVKCSIAIYSSMSRLFRVSTRRIKPANYKSFLAFSIWLGLFPNFRKIELTVSYNQFLIKICMQGTSIPGWRILYKKEMVISKLMLALVLNCSFVGRGSFDLLFLPYTVYMKGLLPSGGGLLFICFIFPARLFDQSSDSMTSVNMGRL